MALLKEIKLTNGTTLNYHRIYSVSYNMIEKSALVTIYSYIDKKYRDREKELISIKEQADSLFNLLNNDTSNLPDFTREVYNMKFMKLIDILQSNHVTSYYIQMNEVKIWDILEFNNINYIYKRLSCLELYSDAKEV